MGSECGGDDERVAKLEAQVQMLLEANAQRRGVMPEALESRLVRLEAGMKQRDAAVEASLAEMEARLAAQVRGRAGACE